MPNRRNVIVKLLVFCLAISLSDIQNVNSFSSFRASRNKNTLNVLKGLTFQMYKATSVLLQIQAQWQLTRLAEPSGRNLFEHLWVVLSVENLNSFLLLLHGSHFVKSCKRGQRLWVQKLLRKLKLLFGSKIHFRNAHSHFILLQLRQ